MAAGGLQDFYSPAENLLDEELFLGGNGSANVTTFKVFFVPRRRGVGGTENPVSLRGKALFALRSITRRSFHPRCRERSGNAFVCAARQALIPPSKKKKKKKKTLLFSSPSSSPPHHQPPSSQPHTSALATGSIATGDKERGGGGLYVGGCARVWTCICVAAWHQQFATRSNCCYQCYLKEQLSGSCFCLN